MGKNYYSYRDCLTYFLSLLRKNYRKKKKFFLSKPERFYHHLITLCGVPPAVFWAYFQEQKLSYLEYKDISRKIRSYLVERNPIPYINGECSFFGILIRVKKGVFIPQPDTEVLVNAVLLLSRKIWPLVKKNKVLEIGCGSGNIAIALASKIPSWCISAVDISKKALFLAQKNAFELGISNVHFFFSDKFSKVTGKFHIIVSNPPYVSSSEYELLDEFTKKQPREALLSANNGYLFYESIMKEISLFLRKKFLVVLEIGSSQGERVVKTILKYFPCVEIETFKDFNENTRVVAFYQW